MKEYITIMETKLYIGDKLVANKNAQENGICKCGDTVEVKSFLLGERTIVGLYSPHRIKGWSDLDGTVPPGRGLWQDSRFIFDVFEPINQEKMVTSDFNFKKRNLKGMRCKIVHNDYTRKQSFVEFKEDIGGGSADGLGKMGCCIVLPSELLGNAQENISKEKKKNSVEQIEESSSDSFGVESYTNQIMDVYYNKYTHIVQNTFHDPIFGPDIDDIPIKKIDIDETPLKKFV